MKRLALVISVCINFGLCSSDEFYSLEYEKARELLNLPRKASPEEVAQAYKRLSMRWHPDKNSGVNTTAKMQEINKARKVIDNEESRIKELFAFKADWDEFIGGTLDLSSIKTLEDLRLLRSSVDPDINFIKELKINSNLSSTKCIHEKALLAEDLASDMKKYEADTAAKKAAREDFTRKLSEINYYGQRDELYDMQKNKILYKRIATFGSHDSAAERLNKDIDINVFGDPNIRSGDMSKLQDLRQRLELEGEATTRAGYAATGTIAAISGIVITVGGLVVRSIYLDK
jgi:curved DNA-binding protein CbpA